MRPPSWLYAFNRSMLLGTRLPLSTQKVVESEFVVGVIHFFAWMSCAGAQVIPSPESERQEEGV